MAMHVDHDIGDAVHIDTRLDVLQPTPQEGGSGAEVVVIDDNHCRAAVPDHATLSVCVKFGDDR